VDDMLRRAHDLLDAANADIDHAACQYCASEGYDGDGLRHEEDCIITVLRRHITMASTPTIGRIVHYRYAKGDGRAAGVCRPAIIVHCWGDLENSAVQLQVFNDADAEGKFNDQLPPVLWKTSIVQGTEPGQFHFHEDCVKE
jgi:hypothetical protein